MKTMKSSSNPKSPFQWSWSFFEALIVAAAVAAGLAIWFVPNFAEGDTMKKLEAAVAERKATRLAREAKAAAIQKEIEEERDRLGLVYFGPGAVPLVDENGEPIAPPPAK